MKRRPVHHEHPPANLNVALMQVRDIPLHFYRYLMHRTGRQWHWVWRLRMDDEELAGHVHDARTEIMVLYLDGAPAGFFEVNRNDPLAVELAYFGLMEHAIGIGLGRWFLAAAIERCWAESPDMITVHTCTLDHPAALGLYQKMGFVPVGRSEETIVPLGDRDHLRLAALG